MRAGNRLDLWRAGTGAAPNASIKALRHESMLSGIMANCFYIHHENLRSQRAIQKLGNRRIHEIDGFNWRWVRLQLPIVLSGPECLRLGPFPLTSAVFDRTPGA